MRTRVIVKMMFKTRIRRSLTIAVVILVTTSSLIYYSILKRQTIEEPWSDPRTSLSGLKYTWNEHRSYILIQCAYQLSQKAKLRWPHVVWKNTVWEREITDRVNLITSGAMVATVASDGTSLKPLPFERFPDRTIFVPLRSAWLLGFPQSLDLVSLTNTQTIYQAPAIGIISSLTLTDNGTNVTFCLTQGWQTKCLRLNLENLDTQVLYTFDSSGAHGARIAPDAILYLDPDPRYTILIKERGPRPQTGTLAIGIDPNSNKLITVLHPRDMFTDAKAYQWMLSLNKNILGLKFDDYKGNKSFWISKTGTPPDFHIVNSNQWNEIMTPNKEELPASVELSIKTHIRKQLTEEPGKKNYYKPL